MCNYLYVLGVDLVGVVEIFFLFDYVFGDCVVLNGWWVGEVYWGGYVGKVWV